jgi:prepilin-type N-terminal cleavage/methylation domain-containing protein
MFRRDPNRNSNRSRAERGYSLIELAVVVLILGIAAAFLVPQALAYMRMYRLGVGGRNVATALQRARFLATSNNTRAGIIAPNFQLINIEQYDPEGKLEPQLKGIVELPNGVTLASDAPKQIAFDGRGVVTPMPKENLIVRLNGPRGYFLTVTVSPTGQVTISEAKQDEKI